MNRTVVATVVKTIKLDSSDAYSDYTDEQIVEMFNEDFNNRSFDDWRWDDESVTIEVFKTEDVYLGEKND